MADLLKALALAFGQIGDRAILMVVLKSVAISLGLFALAGSALWWLLEAQITGLTQGLGDDDYTGIFAALLTALITGFAGWLLFRIVALAVIQFFADDVVRAVEAKHYGHAADVPSLPFKTELGLSVKSVLRALLFNAVAAPIALILLFTGFGPALVFWAVNALLLGRELQDMVWLRHRGSAQDLAPISGLTRFALGGVIALGLAIPFANLLAPVIGAATATHLVHRAKDNDTKRHA